MAKRFTDNNKWNDAWFMDLPSKYKLFWLYILDECDHAGVWKVNFKVAQFMIGEHLEVSEVKRYLKDRLIEVNDEYWFLPKFLKFQYPKGLKPTVKAQESVINILIKHELILTVKQQLGNSYLTVQDKDKDKDKDKDVLILDKKEEEVSPFSLDSVLKYFKKYAKEQNFDFTKVKFQAVKAFEHYRDEGFYQKNGNKIKNLNSAIKNNFFRVEEIHKYKKAITPPYHKIQKLK